MIAVQKHEVHVNPEYRKLYPRRTAAQLKDLEGAILSAGRVHAPILIDELGAILDGHHRYEIAQKHGIENYRCDVQYGLSEKEKRDLIFSTNVGQRPALSNAQKREAVESSLRADPELSGLEHANRVGVAHSFVKKIREELIVSETISDPPERRTADGKRAPGPKPKKRTPPKPEVSDDGVPVIEGSSPTLSDLIREAVTAAPSATRREIATITGASPSLVSDVVAKMDNVPEYKGHPSRKRQLKALDDSTIALRGVADGFEAVFTGGFEKTCTPNAAGAAARGLRIELKRIDTYVRLLETYATEGK